METINSSRRLGTALVMTIIYFIDTKAPSNDLYHRADNHGRTMCETKQRIVAIAPSATNEDVFHFTFALASILAATCVTRRLHEHLDAERLHIKYV